MSISSFNLQENSLRPTYSSIADELAAQIESGRLRPGDALQSTRQLAEQLGMSRGDIRSAYKELLQRGYIEGRRGSKTIVRQGFAGGTTDTSRLDDQPGAQASAANAANWLKSGHRTLPITEWRTLSLRYLESTKVNQLNTLAGDTDLQQLKRAISQYLLRYQGIRCDESQLLIFSNREQAFNEFSSKMLKPGDVVATEDPCDPYARSCFQANGAALEVLPVDHQGLQSYLMPTLPKETRVICTSPTNHYPLGVIMSLDRRAQLLAWTEQPDRARVTILEEANECDYQYAVGGLPSLYELSKETPVFYLYSFGKLLYPLTNVTVLVVPKDLCELFKETTMSVSTKSSTLELAVLTDFISEGFVDSFIRRRQRLYKRLRQTLFFELTMALGNVLKISREVSAHHLVVTFPSHWSAEQVVAAAGQAGIPILRSQEYYYCNSPTNQFLVGFSFHTPDEIVGRVKLFASLLLQINLSIDTSVDYNNIDYNNINFDTNHNQVC